MTPSELLSRKLDPVSCRVVGARVQTNQAALLLEGLSLPEKLRQRAASLAALTDALASQGEDEFPMRAVDRYTDRCVASFAALLGAVEGSLVEHPSLPAPPEAVARAKSAERLRLLCFPTGTSFLTSNYDVQWTELDRLQRALRGEEATRLVNTLGLSLEVSRVSQWIALYGERQGLTAVRPEPKGAQAQKLAADWNEAYAALMVQVFAAFDEATDPVQTKVREAFAGPYREALDRLRAYDRPLSPQTEKPE